MADSSKQGFLNSLFQWTVKNTAAESIQTADTSTTSDGVTPMNEEKKNWLNEALENITVNPVERLKICINKLKEKQTTDQEKKEFLEELCHWTDELDLAKDFFTLGGLEVLTPLFDHPDDEIRMKACGLLATLVQNNDHCQRIIVQSGLQEKLLKILEQSTNPDVQVKAVTAISALIRGYTLGQLQLQKYQGHKILLRSLSLPIPRLQNKLCFLINTICSSSAHMKKIFYESGALDEFIRLFNSATCSDYNHVLQTILTFASAKTNALTERDPVLLQQFEENLTKRLQVLDNPEDHQEEITIINQLQSLLKPVVTEAKSQS